MKMPKCPKCQGTPVVRTMPAASGAMAWLMCSGCGRETHMVWYPSAAEASAAALELWSQEEIPEND